MLGTPKSVPKSCWQCKIDSTNANNNETPSMHINHPIKISHMSITLFGNLIWGTTLHFMKDSHKNKIRSNSL